MFDITEKQKDNFARFFYDIAKIDFAALVVAQFTSPTDLKILRLVLGIIATVIPLFIAITIDKMEIKPWQVLKLFT